MLLCLKMVKKRYKNELSGSLVYSLVKLCVTKYGFTESH